MSDLARSKNLGEDRRELVGPANPFNHYLIVRANSPAQRHGATPFNTRWEREASQPAGRRSPTQNPSSILESPAEGSHETRATRDEPFRKRLSKAFQSGSETAGAMGAAGGPRQSCLSSQPSQENRFRCRIASRPQPPKKINASLLGRTRFSDSLVEPIKRCLGSRDPTQELQHEPLNRHAG
jgi:hypothetical protein